MTIDGKYYLNSYIAVTMSGDIFFFGVPMDNRTIGKQKYHFQNTGKKIVIELIQGKGFKKDVLIINLGQETVDELIKNKILLNYIQDVDSICSRTNAYFDSYINKRALNLLRKSTVLVLGCGGIGTHVAWNLTSLGVGRLILLDYDFVELSNLNRQLLYNIHDVGRIKVDVLKEKLTSINPNVDIISINKKIADESMLEEICLEYPCDLIIKSLDSPTEFPVWLDRVCSKLEICYISGTTSGVFSLIGPTYIPGYSSGYTDFFDSIKTYDIVSGIAPSVSTQLSSCACAISNEAFKILTKIDPSNLQYIDKIHYIDILHNIEMDMLPRNSRMERDFKETESKRNSLLLCGFITLIFLSLTGLNYLLWVGVLAMTIIPAFIYSSQKGAAMASFINISWYMAVGILITIIRNNLMLDNVSFYVIISNIIFLFVFYSVVIIIGILITSLTWGLKNKILKTNGKEIESDRIS